jgi:hypothetical protein
VFGIELRKGTAGFLERAVNLSDAQARELLSPSPTIKAILANSLKKKMESEATHEETMKGEAEKAETTKKQAVTMEGK